MTCSNGSGCGRLHVGSKREKGSGMADSSSGRMGEMSMARRRGRRLLRRYAERTFCEEQQVATWAYQLWGCMSLILLRDSRWQRPLGRLLQAVLRDPVAPLRRLRYA